jgi:hypothetical protein
VGRSSATDPWWSCDSPKGVGASRVRCSPIELARRRGKHRARHGGDEPPLHPPTDPVLHQPPRARTRAAQRPHEARAQEPGARRRSRISTCGPTASSSWAKTKRGRATASTPSFEGRHRRRTTRDRGRAACCSTARCCSRPTSRRRPTSACSRVDRSRPALADVPFELEVHLPRRAISELDTLPSPLRQLIPRLAGEIRVDAELSGTPSAPYAYLSAQAFRLGSAGADAIDSLVPPIDLRLGATYEADDAKLGAELEVLHEGVEVAHVSAAVEVAIEELATSRRPAGRAACTPSCSSCRSPRSRCSPTETSPGSLRGRSRSRGSTSAGAERRHRAPVLGPRRVLRRRPDLRSHLLERARRTRPGRRRRARADDEVLGAGDLRIDLEGQDGGAIQILAHAGFRWEGRSIPLLNRERRGGLVASAERFRLAAAFPFVSDSVSRLDGYLDGKVALEWGRIEDAARGRVALADLRVSEASYSSRSSVKSCEAASYTSSRAPSRPLRAHGPCSPRVTSRPSERRGASTARPRSISTACC